MTKTEYEYRGQAFRVGVALLLLLLLLTVRGLVLLLLPALAPLLPPALYAWLSPCLDGLLYALAFLLPALVFCAISRGKGFSLSLSTATPTDTYLWLFVGLAALLATSALNTLLLSTLGHGSASPTFFLPIAVEGNTELAVKIILLAVIPAFVEELLFRGVILSALSPYCKGVALVISAVLFGLMHQNVGQLLFAMLSGLVLGALYLHSRSLWPCVLLHFLNNLLTLLGSALYAFLPAVSARRVVLGTTLLLVGLGFACLARLLIRHNGEATPPREAPDEGLPVLRRLSLLATLPTVVFVVLSLGVALAHLLIF
jgi:membrane protease YdiL (CAAX protease family)